MTEKNTIRLRQNQEDRIRLEADLIFKSKKH